jgi:hypothetical protein
MADSDWYSGDYEINWTGASPLGLQGEITGQADSDLCDFKLSSSGILTLRSKADGRLIHCAPHTWVTVSVVPPQPESPAAPKRIR